MVTHLGSTSAGSFYFAWRRTHHCHRKSLKSRWVIFLHMFGCFFLSVLALYHQSTNVACKMSCSWRWNRELKLRSFQLITMFVIAFWEHISLILGWFINVLVDCYRFVGYHGDFSGWFPLYVPSPKCFASRPVWNSIVVQVFSVMNYFFLMVKLLWI